MALPKLHLSLPQQLEKLLPGQSRGLAFGIAELDQRLPGGLPRGQITAFEAPPGSGGTALLMALAETTLRAGDGVALVDAARTLAPQAAAHLAELGQFWVIRPRGTESAWWCADVLLRTGAFGLMVVDQAPAPPRRVAVRLQRLARDKDAVLVIREAGRRAGGQADSNSVPNASTMARGIGHRCVLPVSPPARLPVSAVPAVLRLSVIPAADGFIAAVPGSGAAWPGPRTIRVDIVKGGAPRAAEVVVGFALPHRLRPHWAVRDRRPGAGSRGISGRGQRPRAGTPDWPDQR